MLIDSEPRDADRDPSIIGDLQPSVVEVAPGLDP
jgi:hypothetical protein